MLLHFLALYYGYLDVGLNGIQALFKGAEGCCLGCAEDICNALGGCLLAASDHGLCPVKIVANDAADFRLLNTYPVCLDADPFIIVSVVGLIFR